MADDLDVRFEMNKKLIWFIAGIIILGIAYYFLSPLFIVIEANDSLPTSTVNQKNNSEELMPLLAAPFVPSAHEVSGRVAIYEINNQKILRFEDFNTVNGPDLFIYLATDATATDFVNLGEIKATKGNVNYDLPVGVDLNKYDTVLVWCKQFKVLFSYAELK